MDKNLQGNARKMQYRKFRRRRRLLKGAAVLLVTLAVALIAVRLPLGGEGAIAADVEKGEDLSLPRTLQMKPLSALGTEAVLSRVEEPQTEPVPEPEPEPEPVEPTVDPAPVTPFVPSGSTLVAQSAAADASYFDDAVFIGNSQMVGFANSTDLSGTYYCAVGLNASSFFTSPVAKTSAGKVTIPQALRGQSFSKAYVLFGVNEFGWSSVNAFVAKYEQVIATLRENNPNMIIYVESVLPVSEFLAQSNGYGTNVNNGNVAKFNEALYAMCERLGVYYLDIHSLFVGEDGKMPVSNSSDGLHVNRACVAMWSDYLKTHTAQ